MVVMNLADPELELIDPTPNVRSLFVHFDKQFFWNKLIGRALVRWSKRMYSSAGICSYEGKGGLCDIALSEPLLKLRPRKDLVETLLHEMIHAFLFITNRDNDRDGHGPNFQAHMHRINREAGLNISIYHDFHDEVESYLKHWWRCNGRCQTMKPYFGIVRRLVNRAPGPYDYWWKFHERNCGGTFVKIKEPGKILKPTKKSAITKTNADITKWINNNMGTIVNKNINKGVSNNIIGNKGVVEILISKSPADNNFLNTDRQQIFSDSVSEKVRSVWIKKQQTLITAKNQVPVRQTNEHNTKKHKASSSPVASSPKKMKKIDDYFKTTASSILKDVYGKEFIISQSNTSIKLKAVTVASDSHNEPIVAMKDFVNCPNCNDKVYSNDINRHLDECLNKDTIEKLSKEVICLTSVSTSELTNENRNKVTAGVQEIPPLKPKTENNCKTDSNKNTNKRNTLKEIVGNIQAIPQYSLKTDNIFKIENNYTGNKTDESEINNTISNEVKTKKTVINTFHADLSSIPSTSKEVTSQTCTSCGNKVKIPMELHLNECLGFFDNNTTIPIEGSSTELISTYTKIEPSDSTEDIVQKCPCCGNRINKPIELHLDECLVFFSNNTTVPVEGASVVETIVIDDDDDDIFDESQTLNSTGTKSPCPCCLKMIEIADMNDHLDICLSTSLSLNSRHNTSEEAIDLTYVE